MADNKLADGTRIGADLHVKRANGLTLENSSVVTINKNEKIEVDVVLGFGIYQVQDASQLPSMKLQIESTTTDGDSVKKPSVKFGMLDNNTSFFTLYDFNQKGLNENGSAFAFMKKIGEMDGISIMLEIIVTPVINNKNSLVLTLNIYSKI